jgi:hypothetical protein
MVGMLSGGEFFLTTANYIYNMNIYFKVVEVQIQALEYIPKLGRDTIITLYHNDAGVVKNR